MTGTDLARSNSLADLANTPVTRQRNSHIFAREDHGHYVEETWNSARLFEVEDFGAGDTVVDPCCGWGRILANAVSNGYRALGADIVDRDAARSVPGISFRRADFLQEFAFREWPEINNGRFSIVCDPPFDHVQTFAESALALRPFKVAMIMQLRRLGTAFWTCWPVDTLTTVVAFQRSYTSPLQS
jgi:hypothetical protein